MFSFCSKRESPYPRLIIPDADDIVEVNTKHMLKSEPELLAINFGKDTTILPFKERNSNNSIVDFKKDTIFPRFDLKIIIDTTYDFHSKYFEYKWCDEVKVWDTIHKVYGFAKFDDQLIFRKYFGKYQKLRDNDVAAYPLLIYNRGNKNAYLKEIRLYDFRIIQEAKDVDGKWKPIEYRFDLPSDILDYYFYKLQPKKYIATSIIKYNGDFKTKLRVKVRFGTNYYYSNEITGSINRSQFNTDFIYPFLGLFEHIIGEKKDFPTIKKGMLLQYQY